MWLKLDKHFFLIEDYIYFAIVYIPPESSLVYNTFDIDIYRQLETDVNRFKDNEWQEILIAG